MCLDPEFEFVVRSFAQSPMNNLLSLTHMSRLLKTPYM